MFSVSDLRCVTVVFLIVIATAVIVRIIMAIIIIIMFTSCYAVLCPQGLLYNSIKEI